MVVSLNSRLESNKEEVEGLGQCLELVVEVAGDLKCAAVPRRARI